MHFKLIIVMVEDEKTNAVLKAARDAGATGATVLNQARGEGITPTKTFLGLSINAQVDVLLMLVEEHLSRHILEEVAEGENSTNRRVPASLSNSTWRTPSVFGTRFRL